MHGGSSLYALDDEALAAAEPDLILTQELCRVCAVSYREVNEVARRDRRRHHGRLARADARSRGSSTRSRPSARWPRPRTPRSTSSSRCASGSAPSRRPSPSGGRAAGRPPRVVSLEWLDPPFAAGHWVPEQVRRAGGWDVLGAGRRAVARDDLGRGRRGRPGDARPDAVRLPPRRDRRRVGADAATGLVRRPAGGPPRRRSSRSTDRRTSAGPGRGSSTASSCWPRSSTPTRSRRSRRSGRGPRSRRSPEPHAVPRVASAACGAAPRTPVARPDDLEGWAQLCPDCLGKAGDNGVPAVPAAPGHHGARAGRVRDVGRRGRDRPGAGDGRGRDAGRARAAVVRPARRSLDPVLRGARRRVRRLVPPPRPLRARRRSTTPSGTPSSTWPADGSTACPSRGEIVELAAGTGWWSPLLAAKGELSIYDASAAPLERARDRLVAHGLRAHLHVRDAWAEPDRPVDARVHRLLAEPRPARATAGVPRARPALAQAGRPVRVHRFAAGPAVVGGRPPDARRRRVAPPPRRRPRVHDRQGLLRARTSSRPRSRRPGSRPSRSRPPAGSSCWDGRGP